MEVLVLGGVGGHSGQAFAISYFLKKEDINFDVLTVEGTEARFRDLARKVLTAPQALEVGSGRFRARKALKVILRLISLRKYKVVIANGSNFAVPFSLWEKVLGAKLINLEMLDAVVKPTRSPRLLHKFSTVTFVQWEEMLKHYKGAKVSGPVYEPPLERPEEGDYLLVTAGTLGYRELFDSVVEELGSYKLVLQTGKVPPDAYRRKAWKVFSYSANFHKWIARAKAVIGVFPGTTPAIARLAYSKPVVIVPNYHLRRSTPFENMRPFAKKLRISIGELGNLEDALEEAFQTPPPKYQNGAERIAGEVASLL